MDTNNKESLAQLIGVCDDVYGGEVSAQSRLSLDADAAGLLLLCTALVETNESRFSDLVCSVCGAHDSILAPPEDEYRWSYVFKFVIAVHRVTRFAKLPDLEVTALALAKKCHAKFLRAAGTERPRIWGAMDSRLDEVTDRAEGSLDGFWALVAYELFNSTSDPNAPPVCKLEAEPMERIVKATVLDYHSNDPKELGEALWLASLLPNSHWATQLRDRAFTALEAMWKQGYFDAEVKFRRVIPELWMCFGIAVSSNISAEWRARAQKVLDLWRAETMSAAAPKEQKLAFALASFPGVAWRGYRADPTEDLMKLSVRQLRQALQAKGINYNDCVEKKDLIDRLLKRR